MNRSEFYFDSRDGVSQIHAVKWLPDIEPKGVIILVHGMAEHLGRYEELAEFFCNRGFVVAGNEHLGHGGSVNDNPKGYFCRRDAATVVVRDVHRLKKTVQNEFPMLPVFIFGHSMGSLITRNYLIRYGTGVNGAIICGTLMQSKATIGAMGLLVKLLTCLQGSKHPSKILNYIAFGSYCKRIENPRTPYDWLTKDVAIVNKYIADEDCGFLFTLNGFNTLRLLLKRLHDEKLLCMIPKKLPVLFVYGEEDPCGEYGVAVRKVYEQYKSLGIEDVTEKGYPGDRHEIFNELDRENVMMDIFEWIDKRC